MKKLLFAALFLAGFSAAGLAQTPVKKTPAKTQAQAKPGTSSSNVGSVTKTAAPAGNAVIGKHHHKAKKTKKSPTTAGKK